MLQASQWFHNNVYPTDVAREIRARAYLELFDENQYANISSFQFSEAPAYGLQSHLTNVVLMSKRKYATFEEKIFKLDGSCYLLPDVMTAEREVGWVSSSISDNDGNINISATMIFTNVVNTRGISVNLEDKYEYWVTNATASFYDSANALIKTVAITDNESYSLNFIANANGVKKIIVTFTKLSMGHRRLRILEFSPGVLLQYFDRDIVGMTTLNELKLFNDELITPEATITIRNEDRSIDILNTAGIEPWLQRRQKIKIYLGLVADGNSEYILLGNYYLYDWKAEPTSLTAQFIARGFIDRLADVTYKKGKYTGTDRTLYAAAQELFVAAGVTNYSIDASLQTMMFSGIIPVAPIKELLRLICQAANCRLYVDTTDKIYIKPINFVVNGNLDQSQMPSPNINLDKLINRIVIPVSTVTVDTTSREVAVYEDVVTGQKTIEITHDFTAQVTVAPTVTNCTLNSWTTYDNSTVVTVTPNNGEASVKIVVNGYQIKTSTSDYSIEDAESVAESGVAEVTVENAFINNNVVANNVGAYQLSLYKQRYLYNVSFRQNPVYEAGDIITMQDDFDKNYPVIITRNNVSYAGSLSGTIDGRSVYNNVNG